MKIFSKALYVILAVSLLLTVTVTIAAAPVASTVCLFINKSETYLDDQKGAVDKENPLVAPFVKDNRTLVPVRFIAESFGAEVSFDDTTATIIIRSNGGIVTFVLGSNSYIVNNQTKTLDVAAGTYNDRTFIPLRAMAEAMGKKVYWDNRGLIVISNKELNKDSDRLWIEKMVLSFTGEPTVQLPELSASKPERTPDEIFSSLPEGERVIPDGALFKGTLSGGTYGTGSNKAVKGMPFEEAMQFETTTQPPNTYSMQYRIPINVPLKKGDSVLLKFAVRCIRFTDETGAGNIGAVVELNKDPYTKMFDAVWPCSSDWTNIYKGFTVKNDAPAGTLNLNIRLGYKPQIIEIADVELINYKTAAALDDLPQIALTYKGRETDAQWRKDALERIETYRKSNINIVVKDAKGNPIPNADIRVKMTRNEFSFGTAVSTNHFNSTSETAMLYKEYIKALFNCIVPENALKWPAFLKDRQTAINMVNWSLENGMRARGHCVLWDKESHLAQGLLQIQNKNEIKKQILDHVDDVMNEMEGKLIEWDVVNEPTNCNTMRTTIFDDKILLDWYQAARAADPNTKLYVNETGITGSDSPHAQTFTKILDGMVDNKVPFDGIGIQGHFNDQPPSMDGVIKQFQYYAKYGKELKVTEYDTTTPDQKLAADFLRDYLTAAYSIPEMTGFLMWGFWDGAHWRSSAAIFYKDWSLKPSGQVWKDLVLGEWKTDASGKSDNSGNYSVRGHLGEYEVTAASNGNTKTVKTVVKRGVNGTVEIILE